METKIPYVPYVLPLMCTLLHHPNRIWREVQLANLTTVHCTVTHLLLGLNIFLTALYSNTCLFSYLNMRNLDLHVYKLTGRIISWKFANCNEHAIKW
jgi:hypothetical protein